MTIRPTGAAFQHLAFIGLILLLMGLSFISYRRIIRLNSDIELVNHTNLVKEKLEKALSYIKDAETGQRGFLLTRDSSFFAPYVGAKENAVKLIEQVEILTDDNKPQQQNARNLRVLALKRFDILALSLALADSHSPATAGNLAEGKKTMDLIRNLVAQMQQVENDLLKQREQASRDSFAITPVYLLAFSVLAIMMLAFAYSKVRDETLLRYSAEDSRAKIEELETRSRLAIDAAELGTFDWDLKKQEFNSSQRVLRIFGFNGHPSTRHQDLLDRFHPDDRGVRNKAVEDSFAKGTLAYEARIIWPDASVHWVSVFGKILHSETGEPQRMYGIVMDITRQKTILAELTESETRFRLLADSMPQLIWTSDASGNMVYFNRAVFEYAGLDHKKINNDRWFNIVHPDDKEENLQKWAQAIQSGVEFIFEHRLLNRNGEYRWQLSRALPQRDEEGKIQGWVGTSTDIHEQKNSMSALEKLVRDRTRSLEEANFNLEKTIGELKVSNAELESFNYVASHDLQEPLRKIIAFTGRILDKDGASFSELTRDYFNRVMAAAVRMRRLIDAFLSYSRTTNTNAVFEPTDLNAIVREVRIELQESPDQKPFRIICGKLPVVQAIPFQMHQLFDNLIENAIKYSRPGIDPEINISAEKVSGSEVHGANPELTYWKISVADNGIGFDQQYAEKIFELFQRLHGKSTFEGTGIGLAICKKVMHNHKGFISATGTVGTGSVFNVYLPVGSPEA